MTFPRKITMPDAPPRIVLDTNVLYAGLYSASGKSYQSLMAIDEGRVHIALSTPLLFEYEDCSTAIRRY